MSQNLGKLDRIFRFALAFWWLGPWAPNYDSTLASFLIAAIGWVALIESFWGWCWLHNFFRVDNRNQ